MRFYKGEDNISKTLTWVEGNGPEWQKQRELQAMDRIPTQAELLTMSGTYLKQELNGERDRVLFLLTYLTGGRMSEVLEIKAEDFQPVVKDGHTAVLIRLPNRKHKKRHHKDNPIPCDKEANMLNPVMAFVSGKNGHLFLRPRKGGGSVLISYQRAWQILDKVGFNPHWLRHVRITHMETIYGLSGEQLKSFAGWTDLRPSASYMELNWGDILKGMY